MNYRHHTISECTKIRTLLELGYSIRKVAKQLICSPSTISRELKRHAACTPKEAQNRYAINVSNCFTLSKLTPELKEKVQGKLNDTWSPNQVVS